MSFTGPVVLKYRDHEIRVSPEGKFYVDNVVKESADKFYISGEPIVVKDKLDDVKDWLDKKSKIVFDRVKIVRLGRDGYNGKGIVRRGEVTSVTPESSYWVSIDKDRRKEWRNGKEVLDNEANAPRIAKWEEIQLSIEQLQEEQGKVVDSMEFWRPPAFNE